MTMVKYCPANANSSVNTSFVVSTDYMIFSLNGQVLFGEYRRSVYSLSVIRTSIVL